MSAVKVTGAYGRQYADTPAGTAALFNDWRDNRDFRIVDGPYVNAQDAQVYGLTVDFTAWPSGPVRLHTAKVDA